MRHLLVYLLRIRTVRAVMEKNLLTFFLREICEICVISRDGNVFHAAKVFAENAHIENPALDFL